MFDSGVGGLTVLREILRRTPHESTIYLGDTARAPYGVRTDEEVRQFASEAAYELVRRDVERSRDIAASENHGLIADGGPSRTPLSSIAVPTLVIHGDADPMFPLAHGQALAAEIPDARLLTLAGAGHGVDRADWETIVGAIEEQTHPDEQVPGPPTE